MSFTECTIGTKFRDWRPTPVGIISTFLKGYCSSGQLSDLEARWLPHLLYGKCRTWPANCGWNSDAWTKSATEQAEAARERYL